MTGRARKGNYLKEYPRRESRGKTLNPARSRDRSTWYKIAERYLFKENRDECSKANRSTQQIATLSGQLDVTLTPIKYESSNRTPKKKKKKKLVGPGDLDVRLYLKDCTEGRNSVAIYM
ncbi:hypothetical protein GcM3_146021 [Golovinomyces cichoracearum]|uniref:Uncharacterized protein n=1 Tax=Golovinomyces cichoracearum TaxID=62708 RepID=A0A420HYQ5_9PEZI|nr:hypothetical protein GcM3_146021 [Golovinomyces cichoracearum]